MYAFNGICNDGGAAHQGNGGVATCEFGADCNDCGPRTMSKEFKSMTHKVRRYETLNGIAEKWGVRSGALQVWNRIGDPRLLQVEQNVIVTRKGFLNEENKNRINVAKWSRGMRSAKALALRVLLGTSRLSSLVTLYESTTLKASKDALERCPVPDSTLSAAPLPIVNKRKLSDMIELERQYGPSKRSGSSVYWWSPNDCQASSTVAVVIPFRQRESFLPNILARLHPLLQKQRLRYRIFVVDQVGNKPFNRAKLLNVGAVEATKYIPDDVLYAYPTLTQAMSNICYVFHDIDLIPTNDATPYSCSTNANPRHLSVFVDTHSNKCVYSEIYGGVTSMTMNQMVAVNGYSNLYWGWGGEDDDMSARIRRGAGLKISRPVSCYKQQPNGYGSCSYEANCLDQVEIIPEYQNGGGGGGGGGGKHGGIGHFNMVGGSADSISGAKNMNPLQAAQLIIAERRMHEEGMSTLEYNVVATEHHGTYTRVKVEL